MKISNKIICALDVNDLSKAEEIVKKVEYDLTYKIGLEFFYNFGLEGIKKLKRIKKDIKIFLDLKLHDIPNTVSKAVEPLIKNIEPFIITIHATGGKKMMKNLINTVKDVSANNSIKAPLIFGVTVLTSLDVEEVVSLGWKKNINDNVIRYSILSKDAGLDGVICSAMEAKLVKERCGKDFKIITPGIRFRKNNIDDQARVVTPEIAFKNGADFIVMGRPLINAVNPNEIVKEILKNIAN